MKFLASIITYLFLFTISSYSNDNISLRDIDVITDFSYVKGFVEINNKTYIATSGGLAIYDNGNFEYLNHTGVGYLTGISVILNDGDSLIWIGTESQGVLKYNIKNKEFKTSIFFRDTHIYDIQRYEDFLMLATHSGLAIADANKLSVAESYFSNFGLSSNSIERITIKRDSVFIKIDNFIGKCHVEGNFGNQNQWSFFPDSIAQDNLFDWPGKMNKENLPSQIKNNIKVQYWWSDVVASFINRELYVLGFYNNTHHNLVGFNRGEFFRPNYEALVNNQVTSYSLNDDYLTISIKGTSGGLLVIDKNTMAYDNFNSLGKYPSIWLRDVDINDDNMAVAAHWPFYVNEGDSGRNIQFSGGISFTDIITGEIIVYSSSQDDYKYEVMGVEEDFKILFNESLDNIFTQALNYVKYGPQTTLWLITRDNVVSLYEYSNYSSINNDSLLATTLLDVQGAPTAVKRDDQGRLFVSGGSILSILTYNGDEISLDTYNHSANINDFDFFNDSLIVAATDNGIVFLRYIINNSGKIDFSIHHSMNLSHGLPEAKIISVAYNETFNTVYAIGDYSLAVVNLFKFYTPEKLEKSEARVYPVPLYKSDGSPLYIDNLIENESKIRIYSSSGRLVHSAEFLGPGKTYFWQAYVPEGIYYIIVSDNRGKQRLKVLVFN